MDQTVTESAAECYGILGSQLKPLRGGHFSNVYEFTRDNDDYVLRVTPPSDELDIQATRGILEWMHFLSTHGASVSRPVLSTHNRLIEVIEQNNSRYIVTGFRKAKGVLAEELPLERWNEKLFENLGSTVGRMHALAKEYIPSEDSLRRPEWNNVGNCFNPRETLDGSEALISARRETVLDYILALPKDEDSYGLIHTDLHGGNIFVNVEDGTITVFDFDDCSYGWYVMDIAMNLFDTLVLYLGSDKEEFAARFMRSYLRGYTAEKHLSVFWIDQLPYFLKLLEIGVYAQVHKHSHLNDPESWAAKFMTNRKTRIETDMPYVDIDFERVLATV